MPFLLSWSQIAVSFVIPSERPVSAVVTTWADYDIYLWCPVCLQLTAATKFRVIIGKSCSGRSASELAKGAGVTSKTLRHWEHLGLLPKATRTHAGYRVFDSQVTHYVDFIQKSKTVGLTLKETKRVLDLARKGKNPCPQVVEWVDEKVMAVEQQIRTLKALQKRLGEFRQICSSSSVMSCFRPGEMCCLIEDLPNLKNGGSYAKTVRNRSRTADHAGG